MRKGKVFERFKRILISIMCVVTLVFAMPVKAKADIVEDLISLVQAIPDAVMYILNYFVSDAPGNTATKTVNLDGWVFGGSDEGGLKNFNVSPYNIFTAGRTIKYIRYADKNDLRKTDIAEYESLPLLDVNFFSEDTAENSSAYILRPVVGNVYKFLRNLCLVIMMLVLLYIGIKIILSSVSSQQAKYKQLLVDWLVGMCLLFLMHYIMSFIMNINTILVNMLANDEGDSYYIAFSEIADGTEIGSNWDDWMKENLYFSSKHIDIPDENYDQASGSNFHTFKEIEGADSEGKGIDGKLRIRVDTHTDWGDDGWVNISASIFKKNPNMAVYKGNIMEYIRTVDSFGSKYVYLYSSTSGTRQYSDKEEDDPDWTMSLGFAIMYITLTVETVMFLVIYIKRVFQLAMLTMIAPLVALMYPVDKIGDGQAQAFNTWLKDYLFNVLIQPLHLLLYTVFIAAASDLFTKNIIYACGIYGFMIPAEKYFKKIFGFEKGGSAGPGPLGGALGAGMAMRGLDKLTGLGPPGHPGGGKKSPSGDSGSGKKPKIKKLKPPEDSKEPKGDGTNQLPGSLPEKAKNSGKGVFHGAKENIRSKFNTGRNRIAKAATGGKYDRLIGRKGALQAAAKHIGGSAVKKGGRLIAQGAGRGLSMATRGGIGLMAGAATAMATGDINNLTKGVGIGLTSGWNNGGKIANSTIGAVERFSDDAKAWRAENDEEYAKKLRQDEARVAFQDSSLTDEQYKALDELSPYMDFDGDIDKLDAAIEAKNNGASLSEIKQAESDSISWKDLKTKSDQESYLKFQTKERMKDIKDSDIKITQAQIEEQAKLEKQAKIKEAEKKREETANKYDEQIAAAKQAGNKERAKELERKAYMDDQKHKKEIENAQKAKYDKLAAEKNLREQKKQELAQQKAEEDYQRALDFQKTSKKTSK